jgi:hypothetical protein
MTADSAINESQNENSSQKVGQAPLERPPFASRASTEEISTSKILVRNSRFNNND